MRPAPKRVPRLHSVALDFGNEFAGPGASWVLFHPLGDAPAGELNG